MTHEKEFLKRFRLTDESKVGMMIRVLEKYPNHPMVQEISTEIVERVGYQEDGYISYATFGPINVGWTKTMTRWLFKAFSNDVLESLEGTSIEWIVDGAIRVLEDLYENFEYVQKNIIQFQEIEEYHKRLRK